jgi:hypothetical protein
MLTGASYRCAAAEQPKRKRPMLSMGQLTEEPEGSAAIMEEGEEDTETLQPTTQRRRVSPPASAEGDEGEAGSGNGLAQVVMLCVRCMWPGCCRLSLAWDRMHVAAGMSMLLLVACGLEACCA